MINNSLTPGRDGGGGWLLLCQNSMQLSGGSQANSCCSHRPGMQPSVLGNILAPVQPGTPKQNQVQVADSLLEWPSCTVCVLVFPKYAAPAARFPIMGMPGQCCVFAPDSSSVCRGQYSSCQCVYRVDANYHDTSGQKCRTKTSSSVFALDGGHRATINFLVLDRRQRHN